MTRAEADKVADNRRSACCAMRMVVEAKTLAGGQELFAACPKRAGLTPTGSRSHEYKYLGSLSA